jgi:hypothetical protein
VLQSCSTAERSRENIWQYGNMVHMVHTSRTPYSMTMQHKRGMQYAFVQLCNTAVLQYLPPSSTSGLSYEM